MCYQRQLVIEGNLIFAKGDLLQGLKIGQVPNTVAMAEVPSIQALVGENNQASVSSCSKFVEEWQKEYKNLRKG